MTLQIVEDEILGPMQRLFLPPRSMTEGQIADALREYAAALDAFEASDLKAAWASVRDTHSNRSWPLPAAFLIAARQSRKDRSPNTGRKGAFGKEKPTREQLWARWMEVRSSKLGNDAARRGVSWSLRCAILDDEKEAHEINLAELVIAKASAERTADLIDKGKPVPWRGRVFPFSDDKANLAMQMWRNVQIREEETRQEILGAA